MTKWSSRRIPARETYQMLVADAEFIATIIIHSVSIAVMACYFIEGEGPLPGRILTLALGGWAAVRLISRRQSRWWSLADLAAIAVYLGSTPLLVNSPTFTTESSAMLALAGTAVIAFGLAYPPHLSALALVVIVASWSCGIVQVPGAPAPWTVFGLDFLVVEWALVAACRQLVVRAAKLTDQILDAAAADEVTRLVSVARHRQARRHCALMHDTAASTLLMVGDGAVSDRAALAEQAARDIATVSAFSTSVGMSAENVNLVDGLRQLRPHVLTPIRFEGQQSILVDVDIADAVTGAAREALTNIDRHAQASEALIVVSKTSVTISDDGVGFDTSDQRVASRFGVRNSIQARLADVGGHSGIESRLGSGTRVALTWDKAQSDDI